MRLALWIVAAGLTASPAWAVCPEAWTGATYDARGNRVRICAPETAVDGAVLGSGDLLHCTVSASASGGVEVKVVQPAVPGEVYAVQFSEQIRGLGMIAAFCTNSDGEAGDLLGPQSAQFRRLRPIRPSWHPVPIP